MPYEPPVTPPPVDYLSQFNQIIAPLGEIGNESAANQATGVQDVMYDLQAAQWPDTAQTAISTLENDLFHLKTDCTMMSIEAPFGMANDPPNSSYEWHSSYSYDLG